jgi:symplekin
LITKKIWQNPPLWDGFILCAKQTAPSSFGALIQLPRDQLREVVSRQPDLRTGLVEYLTAKAGGNRARLATFMDLLGPDPDDPVGATDAATG